MNNIKLKIKLIILSIKFTFIEDTAHLGNTLGGLLSTFMFTLSFLVFINVIILKYPLIAGYNKDEVLFVALVSQIAFYMLYTFPWKNYPDFVKSVRDGGLDYLLTKPIPHLWYLSFKKIPLVQIAIQGIPTLIILSLNINWNNLNIVPFNLFLGLITFILGQIILDSLSFLFSVPVFWIGASDRIFRILNESIESKIPYEGYDFTLQFILSKVFPILILNVIPASIILGKSDAVIMTFSSFIICILFFIFKLLSWDFAMKNYSSASS